MSTAQKTFYLESFGCQMNVHDSEKVIGTLVQQGYAEVDTVESADLVLYNTCSIRDKAEQKVFHRLNDFKKLQAQGKKFGVLGCVAQQEGEKVFERAPHVSLVAGSASYSNLAQMLVAITEMPGMRRVRFTTSHPRDFTRDIVQAIESTPKLCDHVHLPVQSGSSRVLKAMLREYTREDYLERIAWMKSARRHISMTTDIIVGFPGETDQEFEETSTLLAQVGYDGVFSFKYSPRPNTPAIRMTDSIPDAEKSKRLSILQERQREIQRVNYEKHIGKVLEVMVEGRNEARGQIIGRSTQNKTIN